MMGSSERSPRWIKGRGEKEGRERRVRERRGSEVKEGPQN